MKKILVVLVLLATSFNCSKNDDDTPREEGAPIAVDDTVTTPMDLPKLINVLSNDIDGDNPIDPTSVVVQRVAANGRTDLNSVTGEITYTPNFQFVGIDTFIYKVCDNGNPLLCDTATVTVNVTNLNGDGDEGDL